MFVCTSMDPTAFVQQAVSHELSDFFIQSYSGVLDKRQLIGDILETHQLCQTDTIFVGDMVHDVETAHHGGIASLAVLTGYNTREELSSVSPTRIVQDYSCFV